MSLSVQDRARAIATFRFVEVRLMEIVAAWTPATPEMEVKVMFGRHIWDFAQHADALGKRTFELRQPEHFTLPASSDFIAVLTELASHKGTPAKLSALYNGVLPDLIDRYRAYCASTDAILDAPSVVVIDRIVSDLQRMQADADALGRRIAMVLPATEIRNRARGVASLVARQA